MRNKQRNPALPAKPCRRWPAILAAQGQAMPVLMPTVRAGNVFCHVDLKPCRCNAGGGWRAVKTNFSPAQLTDNRIVEADAILQACVHYRFCTNTCPTCVLTRDENESPRGRIDLIKEMLEDDGPPGPMRAAGKCRRNLSQEAFSLGARRSTTSASTWTRPQTRSEPHAATSNPCSTRKKYWPPGATA